MTKAGTANPVYHDQNGNLVCAGPACTPHDPPAAGTWFMTPPLASGTWEYLYDPENRLVSASTTGTAATYAGACPLAARRADQGNPQGRRVKKVVTGGSFAGTTYFLDAGGPREGGDEIAEYDSAGNLLRRYGEAGEELIQWINSRPNGPAVDQPIAKVEANGTKTFFHQDKVGSVIAMTNTSGAVVEGPFTYDVYGDCFSAGQPCGTGVPYRFTGRRFDPETGLYYYRARYYSKDLGRFLQTDPIGYGDDINWYAYVGNDPTDETDPTGQDHIVCTSRDEHGVYDGCHVYKDDSGRTTVWLVVRHIDENGDPYYSQDYQFTMNPAVNDFWGHFSQARYDQLLQSIASTPSPALRGSPYHPDEVARRIKPEYRPNPAHNPRSPYFNPRKTPEPADAAQAYRKAVRAKMGTWYARGRNGIYRYYADGQGRAHFSGIVSEKEIPRDIARQLR